MNVNPRKILRIARWEVFKTAGSVSRKTVVLAALGVLVGAVAGPSLLAGGVSLDEGIYRVGVDEDSPYRAVVEANPQFTAREPSVEALREGRIDILVVGPRSDVDDDRGLDVGDRLAYRDTTKSLAAYAEFRKAIQAFNDQRMRQRVVEGTPLELAFPVDISVIYQSRAVFAGVGGGSGGSTGGESSGGSGPGGNAGNGEGGLQVPNLGGALTGNTEGAPSSIAPPFPFSSLILAFVFIIPMNFVIQTYGSTIMDERINRRGELMLVSPVSPTDIIVGKTAPYFGVLAVVTVAIAVAIGGGVLAVAAVLPIALLFLAATFVGAMFARSFKELTFVTLTISVFLTSYAFVPAIFTEITPIALISPLTLVVRDLQNTGVSLAEYAFSTGSFYFSGVVLFALGAGVYREEDMFTQRPVHRKAVDALAARISRPRSVLLWSVLFIPFVFVGELLAVALLFALPVPVSVTILLVVIAIVEEIAKSAHVFAGFEHARYDRSAKTAVLVGALSGLGFFVGEKGMVIAQAVGLPSLPQGQALLPASAGGIGVATAAALFLAPLALHTVTATISALGARKNPTQYAAALGAAVLVHTTYNLAVIEVVGGGF